MEKNEIKKALYRQNPQAIFIRIRVGIAHYTTHLEDDDFNIKFEIPIDDMGEADFLRIMDAKFLIRWIVS